MILISKMSILIKNISLILQKMVRVKVLSLHATAENSIRKSNTKGELTKVRYGDRIGIYSEDSSVPTQENESGFVRLAYITKDGIEHVKITYFIILQQGTSDLCVHPFGKMDFHHKIHTSRAKASFFKR